jgi:hypothetical protein
MHTWTDTLPRQTAGSAEGWDHLTVTNGLGTGRLRGRTVALAVGGLGLAIVAGLGVGSALTSRATAPDSSGSATTSGPTTVNPHSRLGPVVTADPDAHPRLGPVVRHGAVPPQGKS